jgi:uncharacterized protein YhaN
MIKEAWDALKAAVLLDSELKRQREDILRALNIIRELAAENAELRTRVARLEQSRASADAQLRTYLLTSLQPSQRSLDFTQHY